MNKEDIYRWAKNWLRQETGENAFLIYAKIKQNT